MGPDPCMVEHFVSVVIIDGISIGCPCCVRHNCHIPLSSNRDRFCPTHHHFDNQCAIIGCDRDIVQTGSSGCKTLVCNDPLHQEIERARTQKGQAHFILKAPTPARGSS